jgi:hypothetical protein
VAIKTDIFHTAIFISAPGLGFDMKRWDNMVDEMKEAESPAQTLYKEPIFKKGGTPVV